VFERMVKLIDLYDARLTNQFLKLLHEIERQQRLREGKGGAGAPQSKEESGRSAVQRENGPTPQAQAASAAPAPSPAATQTSCLPSQPLSFVPPPVVADLAVQADEGTAGALPEQPPAPAPEQSQVVDAKKADAPMTL
jgi:hypothetical protein